MSGFTSTPYDWVRQIPLELKALDEIPLFGNPSSFPWETFSQEMEKALKLDSCHILPIETIWRESKEILSLINEKPFSLTYALNPLKGYAYLLFTHSEIEKLLGVLLHSNENIPLIEKDFIHGFTHFLGLELADAFQKTGYEKSFSPQLLSQDELPDEPCLCLDIAATINGQEIHGMLCISNELRTAIKEFNSKKANSSASELYNKLEITLQLVAGVTTISRKDWHESHPGDFIILDSCSIEPGVDKGRIMLTMNDLPIFRGKIKEGSIKILEYPLFHEVQTQMSPKDFDDEESDFDEEESDVTDSDFDEDESEEEFTEDDHDDEDDEDEYSDDEHYTDGDDDEEEEESEIEEEEEEEEEEETPRRDLKASPASALKPASAPIKETAAQAAPQKTVAAESKPRQSPVKPEDIPITISVEVGRLQMTIQKLTQLEPGNMLELDVHPENGVDLVVNGKCIGKGELLRIGDVLGVRILDKV